MKRAIILFSLISFLACNSDNTAKNENNETKGTAPADSSGKNIVTDTTQRVDIVITRLIDAPVETVWQAWTDPKQVMRWWGPMNYTSSYCAIDLREGGKYVFSMKAPADQGGQEMFTSGFYKKIIPLEYLEFTQGLSDKEGNRIDPATLNMPPDFPKDIRTTLVFKQVGNKTGLTVTEYDWKPGQMRDYSEAGMKECIDKLEKAVK